MSGEKQNIILTMRVFRRELPASFICNSFAVEGDDFADEGDDFEMSAKELSEYLNDIMSQLSDEKNGGRKKTDAEILAGDYNDRGGDYDPEEFLSGSDSDDTNGADGEYYTEDYELTTPASLFSRDGRTVIAYDETELTGMEGSHTEISYASDEPDVVFMDRNGISGTSLIFEQGRRHISVYTAPVQFELCTRTVRVCNSLASDGRMSLEYIVEIRGVNAQYSKLDFFVTFDDNGDL